MFLASAKNDYTKENMLILYDIKGYLTEFGACVDIE